MYRDTALRGDGQGRDRGDAVAGFEKEGLLPYSALEVGSGLADGEQIRLARVRIPVDSLRCDEVLADIHAAAGIVGKAGHAEGVLNCDQCGRDAVPRLGCESHSL